MRTSPFVWILLWKCVETNGCLLHNRFLGRIAIKEFTQHIVARPLGSIKCSGCFLSLPESSYNLIYFFLWKRSFRHGIFPPFWAIKDSIFSVKGNESRWHFLCMRPDGASPRQWIMAPRSFRLWTRWKQSSSSSRRTYCSFIGRRFFFRWQSFQLHLTCFHVLRSILVYSSLMHRSLPSKVVVTFFRLPRLSSISYRPTVIY